MRGPQRRIVETQTKKRYVHELFLLPGLSSHEDNYNLY